MEAINIAEKLAKFSEQWSPKEIGSLDDYSIKLSKIEGDFIWHSHAEGDELFLVLEGRFRMDYRDKEVWLEQGDMMIVPKGVEHKPYADEECSLLVIEKNTVVNTGEANDARRVEELERI